MNLSDEESKKVEEPSGKSKDEVPAKEILPKRKAKKSTHIKKKILPQSAKPKVTEQNQAADEETKKHYNIDQGIAGENNAGQTTDETLNMASAMNESESSPKELKDLQTNLQVSNKNPVSEMTAKEATLANSENQQQSKRIEVAPKHQTSTENPPTTRKTNVEDKTTPPTASHTAPPSKVGTTAPVTSQQASRRRSQTSSNNRTLEQSKILWISGIDNKMKASDLKFAFEPYGKGMHILL